jgi:2-keto-4-pentenoate hydratase/2-oxohepta-3-ene-1,7-dioic acid hydratase in catechol pathway
LVGKVKLLRVGAPGREVPALLLEDGSLADLSPVTADVDGPFLAGGGVERARAALERGQLPPLAAGGERIGPPVARPGKVVCIGQNYRQHAEEAGLPIPTEPVLFLKATDTVVGPTDTVLIPPGSAKTDYEVELAVVIGRRARYLDGPEQAEACVAGYAVADDVSERAYQFEHGGLWDKGKSCETFNPLGPWLVTPDEVGDPQALRLRTWVNGELRQDGHTSDMIFGVHHLVWYLSRFMVLEPGDVVETGTPAGVAYGRPDHPYLRPGDLLEMEVDGLGRQAQRLGQA